MVAGMDAALLQLAILLMPEAATEIMYRFKAPVFDCNGELHQLDITIVSYIDRRAYVWVGAKASSRRDGYFARFDDHFGFSVGDAGLGGRCRTQRKRREAQRPLSPTAKQVRPLQDARR